MIIFYLFLKYGIFNQYKGKQYLKNINNVNNEEHLDFVEIK